MREAVDPRPAGGGRRPLLVSGRSPPAGTGPAPGARTGAPAGGDSGDSDGAMSTGHCRRLLAAYRRACERPTSVLVLGRVRDVSSHGIHLGVIEAAADPGAESRANSDALNDLVEAVLTTTDRLVVAAPGGNATADGVMPAPAADEVWCRRGAVLNPHFRLLGLPGSAYWTCTPRRVGPGAAKVPDRTSPAGHPRPRPAASAWWTGCWSAARRVSRTRSAPWPCVRRGRPDSGRGSAGRRPPSPGSRPADRWPTTGRRRGP